MIIGVDFDNTIVCYDGIFHRLAVERGLIPSETPVNKTAVRDHLRRVGNEAAWTELQGVVYGPRMADAEAFPGVKEFFSDCRARGITVKVVSHKTQFPYAGDKHDLHAAARAWLEAQGFSSDDKVYFEATKHEKLARIAAAGCDVFVDDLPEFLGEPAFPAATRRILFDPASAHKSDDKFESARSWADIGWMIFDASGEPAPDPAAVTALFRECGMRPGPPPVRIAGGGNNRVFEARDDRGARFVLKQYFHRDGDLRNRFEAERLFYALAMGVASSATPRALAWDSASRLGLLEYIEGRPLSGGEIGGKEVDAALAFFSALNRARERPKARALPVASEACFSRAEHCRLVDERVARLRQMPINAPVDREAHDWVAGELTEAWRSVRAAATGSDAPLPSGARCVSPSDFGFHNCLRRADGRLVFFDFEYAGWDDPAKTVADFFCQPARRVSLEWFERFAGGVAAAMGLARPEEFHARCRALLPVYQVKWCCILLNEFVRTESGPRAFALGPEVVEERKARQLAAARKALAACRQSLHGTVA